MKNRKKSRSNHGSTLVLMVAITVGIVIALIFFFLNYGRILGGWSQQKNAIDAAALAAATDISKLVVVTNTCGYVCVSDMAPYGPETAAEDGYYVPIHSINTLIGTARVDMIIADQVGDPTMEALAYNDVLNIVNDALPTLQLSIMDAISASPAAGPYIDVNGNPITPYQDALAAFQSNRMNMTGSAQLAPGSFNLTLGYLLKPTPTNIPVPSSPALAPNPAPQAGLSGSQYVMGQVNNVATNVYLAYTDVPYNGNNVSADFMFPGIGNTVSLCDPRNFQAIPSTTAMPAVATTVPQFTPQMVAFTIGAQAQIVDVNSQDTNPTPVQQLGCAQCGNSLDPRPAPGSLTFGFPDGPVPEVPSVATLVAAPTAGGTNFDTSTTAALLTPTGGDYPGPLGAAPNQHVLMPALPDGNSVWPLSSPSVPATTIPPTIWQVVNLGIFDWIRAAGVGVPVDQALNLLTNPAVSLIANPGMKDWKTIPNGSTSTYDVTTSANPPGPQIPMGYFDAFKWVNQNPATNIYLSLVMSGTVTNYSALTADPAGQMVKPMPYSVVSNGQLYGEEFSAITNSKVNGGVPAVWKNVPILQIEGNDFGGTYNAGDGTLHQGGGTLTGQATNAIYATNSWDICVRSQVCYPQPSYNDQPAANVFDHAGQTLPNPNVSLSPRLPKKYDVVKLCLAGKHGSAESLEQGAGGFGAHGGGGGGGHGGGGGGLGGLFGFIGKHDIQQHQGSHGPTGGTGGHPTNPPSNTGPASNGINGILPSEGQGVFPLIGAENDFDVASATIVPAPYSAQFPWYWTYAEPYMSPYPGGPVRPVYTVNGSAVEVRFRRQVYATGTNTTVGTTSTTSISTTTSGTVTSTTVVTSTSTYTAPGQTTQDTGYFAEEQDN